MFYLQMFGLNLLLLQHHLTVLKINLINLGQRRNLDVTGKQQIH